MIAISLIALYVGAKYFQRWLFMRELRINRITPEATRELFDSGQLVTIVDLRHTPENEPAGATLPGALRFRPEELEEKHQEIPRDRDIVLYCT